MSVCVICLHQHSVHIFRIPVLSRRSRRRGYDWLETRGNEPENEKDNIRVYIPMELNGAAILRRLRFIIEHYGEANEENESKSDSDVRRILSQIEIYDLEMLLLQILL